MAPFFVPSPFSSSFSPRPRGPGRPTTDVGPSPDRPVSPRMRRRTVILQPRVGCPRRLGVSSAVIVFRTEPAEINSSSSVGRAETSGSGAGPRLLGHGGAGIAHRGDRPGPPQHRGLPAAGVHPGAQREAPPVRRLGSSLPFPGFVFWFLLLCSPLALRLFLFVFPMEPWLGPARRDLLDISPALTEAAGAIIDVSCPPPPPPKSPALFRFSLRWRQGNADVRGWWKISQFVLTIRNPSSQCDKHFLVILFDFMIGCHASWWVVPWTWSSYSGIYNMRVRSIFLLVEWKFLKVLFRWRILWFYG